MKEKHKQMYMRMAYAAAETSSAKRLQVGAIAVKNNNPIANGYNGLPSGIDGECEYREAAPPLYTSSYNLKDDNGVYRLVTRKQVRHAEHNLLLNLAKCNESSIGAVIFITHSPCENCAAMIVDSGITKVYYSENYRDIKGIEYLQSNGVEVEQI